jgi:copper chaperone CopZ
MFRRRFVQLIATAGMGSLASMVTAQAQDSETVTYRVKGFSCVTCAVGLDTVLKEKDGIAWSKSKYPDGVVTIKFDPKRVNQDSLKTLIAEMGFTIEEKR